VPYLIDSDWLIDHLAEVPEATTLIDGLATEGVVISVVSYMEAFQGTLREPEPETAMARLHAFIEKVPVLTISLSVAQRCARIRQHLLDQGKRPTRRGFDLLIAATAIEHNLMLVTRNVRDYADIPGIRLYEASPNA